MLRRERRNFPRSNTALSAPAPIADPAALFGQLGPLLDRQSLAMLETLLRQTAVANKVQTAASLVLLAGSIGLLLRKKWGWQLIVVLNLVQAVASVILGQPVLQKVLTVLDPTQAERLSFVMAVLIALIPISINLFLIAKPVISQFERAPVEGEVAKLS